LSSSQSSEPDTQSLALSAAINRWSKQIDDFRVTHANPGEPNPVVPAELELVYEELSVADEELRVQQELLEQSQVVVVQERARYRELFDQAPVPYLVTDGEGMIDTANTAAAATLRIQPDNLAGKPLAVFVDRAARTEFRAQLVRITSSGDSTATIRVRLVSRSGEPIDMTSVVGILRDRDNRVTELRWLFVNDTMALQAEREKLLTAAEAARVAAEAADTAKTQLLATVSHELRTPLTAIGGYAELLELGLRGELNEAQREDVQRVRAAQQHMLALLDDLLLYFRLGMGGLTAEVSSISLTDILGGLTSFVAPQASARRIDLRVESPVTQVRVQADVDRARQILINLLQNAVKFSPSDTKVELSTSIEEEFVDVSVRDRGPGISAETLASVFEPFVQLGLPTATRGGFGLGLAISRRLAELMGGSLSAESTPGEGSVFHLRLKRA
jgi:PAS domain S-box-containing protein